MCFDKIKKNTSIFCNISAVVGVRGVGKTFALLLDCLRLSSALHGHLQMQVVEELHLARSEKRLEVDVLHSCGELTCMDIDPPEEGAANSHCKCAVIF